MNALTNRVQLIGHLGADAEIKTTSKGAKYSSLRIATNARVKLKSGEWKENTQWHTCMVWGTLNNAVQKYGKKGNQLMISGSLVYREYVDAQGSKRFVTEIKVNEMLLVKSAREDDSRACTDSVEA